MSTDFTESCNTEAKGSIFGLPLLDLKLSYLEEKLKNTVTFSWIISGFCMGCLTNWIQQPTCSHLPPTGCSSSDAVKTFEKILN